MTYARVMPRERGIFHYAELWTDGGHLLHVHSSRLTQRHQRFRFADIQAVAVTQLPHWTAPQIAALAGALLLFVWAVAGPASRPGKMFFGTLAAVPLALAIREVGRGPRCRTMIQTAAGQHHLTAVARISRAPAFLEGVSAQVEAIQGPSERIAAVVSEGVHPETRAREIASRQRPLLYGLWAVMLVTAVSAGLQLWRPALTPRIGGYTWTAGLAELALSFGAWNGATLLLRRTKPYRLALTSLLLLSAETVAGIAWAVSKLPAPPQPNAADPFWLIETIAVRVPLALAGAWFTRRAERAPA